MLILSAYCESGIVLPTHFIIWCEELETGLEQGGRGKMIVNID